MPLPKELKPVGDTGNTDEDEYEYESKYGATLLTKSSDLTSITPMPKKLKLLKTCSMLFVYCGLGLYCGVVSPTVVDIAELYNCSYEKYITTSAFKSIGTLTGSFTGALASDRLRTKADLIICISSFIGGLSFLCIPWSPSFILMGFLFFVNGVCHGTLNVLCSSLNIAIWGEDAPTPVHALHLFFTVGTTIAPPLTIPFLSKLNASYADSVKGNLTYTGHVRVPYAAVGIYGMVTSFIFLVYFLKGLHYTSNTVKKRETIKQMLNPKAINVGGSAKYGVYFLISLFAIYVFLCGRDFGFGGFIFIIAHTDVLQMSKPLSAALVTALNLSTAIGRGFSTFISKWITTQIMLFSQLFLVCILQMLMVLYGLDSVTVLFVLTCLYGAASGPTYPTIMSWADRYIEATGMVIAVIDIGIGVGGFIATVFYSYINQTYGSLGIFIVGFVFSIVMVGVITPLQIVGHLKGDRHKNKLVNQLSNIQDIHSTAANDEESENDDDNNDAAYLLAND